MDQEFHTNPEVKAHVDRLLQNGFDQGASDVHLAVGSPPIYRIDGVMKDVAGWEPITPPQMEMMVMALLTPDEQSRLVEDRELDFSYELPGSGVRFRVNTHWERGRIGLVARTITDYIPKMDELDMPDVAYDLLKKTQGLILVTGPTGSGKSTTLAAMIDYLNEDRRSHIVTLEDPIEFVHQSKKSLIRQRQLHEDFLSFPEALKHVLRQDPDIIMVGEMRDLETIQSAITVAETGHLVFATLHTLGAEQTIDRIVDVFPPNQQEQIRIQLSMELLGVLSQRLLPKKGGGRVAAREIMVNNSAVANLIRENKAAQIKSIMQTGADEGMKTLDADLRDLYEKGEITKEIAETYANDPEFVFGEKQ